jgi:hypothetical protein
MVQEEIGKTKALLNELDALLNPAVGPWMFGSDTATALDGNLVPFIARLRELGMDELVPEGIIRYANAAMAKPEWTSVMQGRRTMPSV